MGEGNRDFNFLINNLFYDYTENTDEAKYYSEEINGLETSSSLEEFYKKYIVNLIYLNLEEYEMVFDNAKACLLIYEQLNQNDKDDYRSEYILSRYYVIFLKKYFNKNNKIEDELINLKLDIEAQEKNELLDDLLRKVNLYLLSISKDSNQIFLNDNINDFNYDDFQYLHERMGNDIFGLDCDIDFLSHYTSIGNSFNILEKNELWVTRYDFLNDKSELIYIIDVLEEIMKDFKKEENNKKNLFDKNEKEFLIMIIGFIKDTIAYYYGKITLNDLISSLKAYNYINDDSTYVMRICKLVDEYKYLFKHCFVLSFSKNQNSLPLWGNYTEFTGVNLLLDKENLKDTFVNQSQDNYDLLYFINPNSKKKNKSKKLFKNFSFGQVLYGSKDIKSMLLSDFREALDLHKKNTRVINEFILIHRFLKNILIKRLLVKNNYFSYEEEFRCVFVLDEDLYQQKVNFRCGQDSYVPYIKVPIALENLKEIVVGPRNNSDLVVKGFEEYLTHKKLDVKVSKSNIPFR